MKAILHERYGGPEVLRCEDVEKPSPADDQVLIRVRAASVNPLDRHNLQGTPYLMRMGSGLLRPKVTRRGVDVAGEVEAVGAKVTQFEPGEAVFGACRGAFAEYVCAPESAVVRKPPGITFEQAAAVPVAAVTALQGLRDRARIQAGQRVLINGAAGGVGTFAVQIAKAFGADVTGVCSTRNVSMVQSIGADRVIDYTREDFIAAGRRYDVVFDCVGNHSLAAFGRVMEPEGIFVMVGAKTGRWVTPLPRALAALVRSRVSKRQFLLMLARPRREDLRLMCELMAAGKVTPVIDRRYALSEVPQAIRYLAEGHARGKIVISVSPAS